MTRQTQGEHAGHPNATTRFEQALRSPRFVADEAVLEYLRSCAAHDVDVRVRLTEAPVTPETIRSRIRRAHERAGLRPIYVETSDEAIRFRPAKKTEVLATASDLSTSLLRRSFTLAGYLFWALDAVQAGALAKAWARGEFIHALDAAVWWLIIFSFVFGIGFVFWRLGQEAASGTRVQRLFGLLYIVISALMLGAVSFHFMLYRDYGLLTHIGYIVLVSFVALLGYGLCLSSRWTPRWLSVPFLLVLLGQVSIVTYQAMSGHLLVAGNGLGGTFLLVVACATDALLLYDPEYVFGLLRSRGLVDVTAEVRTRWGRGSTPDGG